MEFSDYKILEEKSKTFYTNRLTDLRDGRISIKDFLDDSEKLENMAIENAEIFTDNFDEFYDYVNKNYPGSINQVEHERKHAKISKKYGLEVKYGLLVIEPPMKTFLAQPKLIQAFLIDSLNKDGVDWNVKKILKYLRDTGNVVENPSDLDKILISE